VLKVEPRALHIPGKSTTELYSELPFCSVLNYFGSYRLFFVCLNISFRINLSISTKNKSQLQCEWYCVESVEQFGENQCLHITSISIHAHRVTSLVKPSSALFVTSFSISFLGVCTFQCRALSLSLLGLFLGILLF
jgi:hypothetical protein